MATARRNNPDQTLVTATQPGAELKLAVDYLGLALASRRAAGLPDDIDEESVWVAFNRALFTPIAAAELPARRAS
jgi:hypothetical protein